MKEQEKETHCWYSTLIYVAEGLAIFSNAVEERTMVVSDLEGLETEVNARSTIFI